MAAAPRSSPPAGKVRRLRWPHRGAVASSYAADRLGTCGSSPSDLRFWRASGRYYGLSDAQVLECGNLIPLAGSPTALTSLGDQIAGRVSEVASVYGRAELVLPLWEGLAHHWAPPRDIRADQHLLYCCGSAVPVWNQVRPLGLRDFSQYLPAAAQMFTEEVGVNPILDRAAGFARRSRHLLRRGRCFGAYDADGLVFKAEVAGLNKAAALIQGVWVRPAARGHGLSAPAMAAVVELVGQRWNVPSVLYVNSYNQPALACYRRCGFTRIGTFATVLR